MTVSFVVFLARGWSFTLINVKDGQQSAQQSAMTSNHATFEERGFIRFPYSPHLAQWAEAARAACLTAMADPAHAQWWRHGRTWFVGVDALPNDGAGALPGGPPLSGEAIGFIRDHLSFQGPWHRAQLSVCCPGYPQRDSNETEAQHNYRLKRDAAHVDGLHGEGPGKRRHFRERHQFILGIPLNETDEAAAPFVVWEGSHHIIGETFATVFAGLPPEQWGDVDVTDAYQKARARVFATRRRTLLHAKPGEAYVAHKYSVHGVSPWRPDAVAPDNMRAIAYFRPAH